MTWWQAIILGIVQGLTEFLPVSSSGHLVLIERWLSIPSAGLLLEVVLHIGTLAAVVYVYWKDVWRLVRHPLKSDLIFLVVATVPAVIASLLLGDYIEELFGGRFLWIGFLLTTAVLLLGERFAKSKRENVTLTDSIAMGCAQALAIMPGLSRSGSTIATGMARGLKRPEAARFSFLMSVPAILGSLVLELKKLLESGSAVEGPTTLLLGAVCAGVSGFFAIRFMIRVLTKRGLKPFAIYTAVLAVAAFITYL